MQKLEVFGVNKLKGQIKISGSKNAALPILAATLLTNKKVYLKNLPNVKDIETMIKLLQSLGSKTKFQKKNLYYQAKILTYPFLVRKFKNILVTGGLGFIGINFCDYLLKNYDLKIINIDKKTYASNNSIIHHYDKKSFHLKTQIFSDYKIYNEAYWQPHKVTMINNQNGKSSVLSFREVKYKNGFDDRDFSQNSLKRSR